MNRSERLRDREEIMKATDHTLGRMDDRDDIYIAADPPEREWQCIECGHVVEATSRPVKCPDCNCVNSDFDLGIHVFIPREACGWFE